MHRRSKKFPEDPPKLDSRRLVPEHSLTETENEEEDEGIVKPREEKTVDPEVSPSEEPRSDQPPVKQRKPFVLTEARAATLRRGREKRLQNCQRLRELKAEEKEKSRQLRERAKLPVLTNPNYHISFL